MLSSELFVRYAMDLNLFFMRIMKEHLIFIEASLSQKDLNIIKEADVLKNEASRLLEDTITLSRGLVSIEVIESGELVTEFTLPAERKTEYYTGIHIDGRLTAVELSLRENNPVVVTPITVQNTLLLNKRAIDLVMSIIAFKEKLYDDVLSCRVYTSNYPKMLEHVIEEAKFYLAMLLRLQNRNVLDTPNELLEHEIFWNHIMEEHAEFIRGQLDPTEEQLISVANMFADSFESLEKEAENVKAQISSLSELTRKSLEATNDIKNFKSTAVAGILGCEIKTVTLPLLADHVLRESNHYLRILNTYKNLV